MISGAQLSICMVSDDFLPSATGVGTHLQHVATYLAKRGHRLLIITTRRPGQPASEVWNGVDVRRMSTVKVFGFFQGVPLERTIEKIIREFQPNLIHFHYLGLMMLRAMRVAERLRLPIVYTYHMTEDHLTQPVPMRPFRSLIARQIIKICNRADLVISVSRANLTLLPPRGIATPIRYISNPVGFRETTSVESVPVESSFAVMFAGRLNPEKNIPLLLRAFSKLLEKVPGAILWVAGEGAQRGMLEQMCADLKISKNVRFLGFLHHDQLSRYYAACDVFVLPSLVETQGLVAMEAMRFSKPLIVARSVVTAEELVDDGVSGYIVDERSPEELAARLFKLASAPDLREKMGQLGRTKSDEYNPDVVIPALEEAYASVLRERA